MKLSLLLASALMASVSLVAHADTFQYNVVFNNGSYATDATFDTSSILTSNTYVAAAGTGNMGPILSVGAYPDGCYNGFFACFVTQSTDGGDVLFFNSPVQSVGTFNDIFGDGTLTISDISSPTPEPSSLLLLGSGLLGLGGVLKRKWQMSAAG